MKLAFTIFSIIVMSSLYATAFAQEIPLTVDPGKVQKRLTPQKTPKLESNFQLPKELDAILPAKAPDVHFVLNNVYLAGNITISTGQLQEAYIPYIGKHITLQDMHEIARKITAIYRKQGYLLSRAIVPVQRIRQGNVRINVIEGYVKDVYFEGNTDIIDNVMAKKFIQDIQNIRPLNVFDLEKSLLIINDLPGVKAKSIFKTADSKQGAADLIVQVEIDKIEGYASVDNRGTKYLGPVQLSGEMSYNGLLGYNDKITVRTIVSGDIEEMQHGYISYMQPVSSDGSTISTSLSATNTEPGSSLSSLSIEGDSVEYDIFFNKQWIRSRKQNLSSSVGVSYRDTETDLLSTSFTEDKIRTLELGINYDVIDSSNAASMIAFDMVRGFSVLDASDNSDPKSRANGDAEFTRFNLQLSRLQPVYQEWYLYFSAAGQYSLDALLASEEFDLGGSAFGSAYDPSEISGDHGAASRIELQNQCLVNALRVIRSVQCYGFYDIGVVWNKDTIGNESSRQTLSSAGLGTRFSLRQDVSGALELAFPLTREVATQGDNDMRGFFGLRYDF